MPTRTRFAGSRWSARTCRTTYDRISEEIYSQPETYPALFSSFNALEARVSRALEAKLLAPRPMVELVVVYHAFCCGLAAN